MPPSPAILVLADGKRFRGTAIGVTGVVAAEVVFNTAMTGYQEILTDPSYAQQIVTLTYPHIGNYGINADDSEASRIYASGLVIRDLALRASNFRSQMSLDAYLKEQKVVAIAGIDTRALTVHLRTEGAQIGAIVSGFADDATALLAAQQAIAKCTGLVGKNLAQEVSCSVPFEWDINQSKGAKFHVVVIDYGVKRNILRLIVEHGCKVTVVPAYTTCQEVLAYQPDGVLLSNGPGDPVACEDAIQTIAQLLEHGVPLFGICLGHQLLALASGARIVKMKFGHHGANHPVQDLRSKRVFITSQNHGFTVAIDSLPQHLRATHISLFDRSLQGIERTDKQAFGFQGHPEGGPGPREMRDLFARFVHLMEIYRG